MIPSIETIAEDLAAGRINIAQAIAWLHQHAEGSANELRDHFAGLAMQLAFSSPIESSQDGKEYIAMHAYKMADAMLDARSAR